MLVSRVAVAQTAAESTRTVPPTGVIAPKIKRDDGAQYPKEALASAVPDPVTVVLVVEVNADGTVRRATVAQSSTVAPIDAAAVAAGEKLVFEPAMRHGRAVAAKIRFTYHFVRPKSRFDGRVTSQEGAPLDHAAVDVVGADGASHRPAC
jgi:TonB family protein